MTKKSSLMSDENNPQCFVCGTTQNLHMHHVYPGHGRRQISDREGCWVYLCGRHHNLSNQGVHLNHELDMHLREMCQRRWEEREGLEGEEAHDAFRRRFHISYL